MDNEYKDSNLKLMRCRACNDLISKKAKSCPCCGEPYTEQNGKKGLFVFYILATCVCIIALYSTNSEYFFWGILGLWFSYAWIMCIINAIRGE